ncbi:DUF2326 domain-containing protein [Gluconacetobacter diazotrophicus]|uniref:DUF2326 domain-containing protein n=1 Tax=Gluconacetobacter diazotrophicus TaxID=33996 RepID=UPI0002D6D980|nr:DUF2326 domain-containing protein [Gluconacetobacter diazotrophicus]
MRIKRLYTEPDTIDPIEFHKGVNIIVGERDETSVKNNGVGKSMCIEFLNFALLKKKSESRVSKIPQQSFKPDTFIYVDFELHGMDYTIKRSIVDAEHPRMICDSSVIDFSKLDDATRFLTERMFPSTHLVGVGFREMLGPLIRDERSEFKSIVACYDTKIRVPDNYAPHLMLLGIDLMIYRKIREILKELDAIGVEEKRVRENVQLIREKGIDDARSDLNELNEEVERIRQGIDALENAPAYDVIKDELIEIEDQTDELRFRKTALLKRLAGLNPIAIETAIDADEIRSFYNQLREGLGDKISKDLNEVLAFKSKIELFQKHLLTEKSQVIEEELRGLRRQLADLDRHQARLIKILDQDGDLRNLKKTYAAFQAKSDELGQLKGLLDRYDRLALDKQEKRLEKETERLRLQGSIIGASERLKSFEQTILWIHQFIQGNRKASFEVRTTSTKNVVDIIMRIDDDGSHSVEREKVFIYDIALLLNDFSKARHPGLLVHDNIFDVDDDTLKRSLEFVFTKSVFDDDQQYILTLNTDRLGRLIPTPVRPDSYVIA